MQGSNYSLILLGIFFSSFNIKAQTDSTAIDSISLDTNHEVYLNEVKVTAFYSKSKLKTIPGAVTIIQHPHNEIASKPNLFDLFSYVPGLYMQQGALNTSRISIRGIGTRYPYGTRKIKVLYNQIPLTNGEGDTFIDDISPEETGNIEVIRGPASSIYGSSLGGTILIHPNEDSSYGKSISLTSNIGSFDYYKNTASFHAANPEQSLNLNITQLNSKGFRENSNYKRTSAALYSSGNLSRNTEYHFLFSFAKVFAQIPSSLDSATFIDHPEYAATTWKNTKGQESYNRIHAGTGITLHPGLNSYLDIIVYSSYRNGSETRPFNLLDENDASIGTKVVYRSMHKVFQSSARFVAGFHIFREFYNATIFENADGFGTQGDKISSDRQYIWQNDIYIQEELDILERLKLTTGLNLNLSGFKYTDRYSTDSINQSGNYKFNPILSPRVAMNYSLNQGLFCYTSLSHGFSLPSLSETLSSLGLINSDVKPERAWNIEAGIRGYIFQRRTFLDVAIYQMWVTDLIVPKRIAEDAYVGMNAGQSDHRGLELAISNRFAGKYNTQGIPSTKMVVLANLNYTYNLFKFGDFVQDERNFSGNYLPGVPAHQLFAELKLETKLGMYVNTRFQSVSKVPVNDDNSLFSPGFNIMDATIGYSSNVSTKWIFKLYFTVNNFTNTKYASMIVINAPGTPSRPPRYYYPGEPLKYRFGIQIRYHKK
jgi:iron complex outermembrane receptor protein